MKTTITVDGKTYVALESDDLFVGKRCIVRCRDAGVHFGTVLKYSGREVTLADSRRLWSWQCKSEHTLSGAARKGLSGGKIAGVLGLIYLPEICELIPCTDLAADSIENQPVHNG